MSCRVCNDFGMVRILDMEAGGWEVCPQCHPPEPTRPAGCLRRLWWWFLARFRLSNKAICEMSKGKELHDDYHDYPDDILGTPFHMVTMTCRRCGKPFDM